MALKSYSPQDVDILLGGFYRVSGFVEDSFINISKDVQPYKTKRSSDGQVARTFIKDDTYTVEISLASSSPANDILTKIYQVDSLSQYAKFPLFIKDTLGSSLFVSPTAWIKQVPDMSFTSSVSDRVWVIQATQATFNIGGNEGASSALEDLANAGFGAIGGFL
jgi:hypothetical protein